MASEHIIREKKSTHAGKTAGENHTFFIVRTIHKMKWAILSLELPDNYSPEVETAVFDLMEDELINRLKQ